MPKAAIPITVIKMRYESIKEKQLGYSMIITLPCALCFRRVEHALLRKSCELFSLYICHPTQVKAVS